MPTPLDPKIGQWGANLLGRILGPMINSIEQMPIYPPNVIEGYKQLLSSNNPLQLYAQTAGSSLEDAMTMYVKDFLSNPMALNRPMGISGGLAGIMAGPKATGYQQALKTGRVFSSTADRAVRWEISDKPMKIKQLPKLNSVSLKEAIHLQRGGLMQIGTVKDFVEHPELFKNYPTQIADMPVLFDPRMEMGNAAYTVAPHPTTGIPTPIMVVGKMKSKAMAADAFIHELSHRISAVEDRALGGNPNNFFDELVKNDPKAMAIAKKADINPNKISPEEDRYMMDLWDKAYHSYRHILGEAEAFDTMARRTYSDSHLAAVPPLTSQIVKEGLSPENTIITTSAMQGHTKSALLGNKTGNPVAEIMKLHSENGGATFNLKTGNKAGIKGYAVAMYPDRGLVISEKSFNPAMLKQFITNNKDLLAKSRENSVGTWANGGKVYLDIVKVIPDLERAKQIGLQNKQKAIFDLLNFKDIDLGGK